jgi:uncharacterized membrane protein
MAITRRWAQRITLLVLILLAFVAFFPVFASTLGADVGLALVVVYLLAYLFAVIALPLAAFSLLKFVYSVFARPYVRAWHIGRIRNRRRLKEVIARGRAGQ